MTTISPAQQCGCGGMLVPPAMTDRSAVGCEPDYFCTTCGRCYGWINSSPPRLVDLDCGSIKQAIFRLWK